MLFLIKSCVQEEKSQGASGLLLRQSGNADPRDPGGALASETTDRPKRKQDDPGLSAGRMGEVGMKIHGLQKMTLLDYPGRVACTVFFGGCNMRCPFCHNAELLDGTAPAVMDDEELLSFLKKRQGLLDGVAFTGGEPLLQKDLPELMGKIRDLGYPVKLDTNGTFPDRLNRMITDGLVQYVAMDIKNSQERYADTAGLKEMDLAPVRESVSLLMEGRTEYEFRTTVVAELHDDRSFSGIGKWIKGAAHYYLQKFTDRETVPFEGLHAPTDDQMRKWAEMLRPDIPAVELRGVD